MALNTAHVCLVCEPSLSGSCRLKKSVRGEVIRVLHPKHVIQDSSRVKEELKASFVLMECTHTDTQGQTHECVKTYECQKSTRAVGKCSAFAGNAVLEGERETCVYIYNTCAYFICNCVYSSLHFILYMGSCILGHGIDNVQLRYAYIHIYRHWRKVIAPLKVYTCI